MAGPNKINIYISAHDRASRPLKKVRNQVRDFRDDLVRFNRRLFTASAVLATFAMGFRKAFQLARVGADFDMFRQQFYKTFGEDFFSTLRQASKGTMDAMSIMQIAVQNHARGLSKYEQQKVFTLSVGAAKLLGTTTADAAKRMSKALHTLSVTGMQNFMVALNTNNQYKNMEVFIKRLTKGLNAAGKSAENFRKVALRELSLALGEISMQTGDAKTMFMVLGAGFQSLRQVVGNFLARALAPLAGKLGMLTWDIFDSLNKVLSSSNENIKLLRKNLVNLMQMSGGVLAVGAGLLGGFSLLALAASTLGVSMGSLIGLLMVAAGAFKKVKDGSKGWMDALANIGAELKFYYQAFTTYTKGVSTFSGDVVDKIRSMDMTSQNRILKIAKFFALLRETWNGFVKGFTAGIGVISTMMQKISNLLGFTTKQYANWVANLAGNVGKVAGGLTVFLGLRALFKGIAGKGIFGFFRGRPKGTISDPLWVQNMSGFLSGKGGVIGGVAGKLSRMYPAIAKFMMGAGVVLKVVSAVLASAAVGAAIGMWLDRTFNLSDKISNFATGKGWKTDQEAQKDYMQGVTGQRAYNALSGAMGPGIKWDQSEYKEKIQESMKGFIDKEGRTAHGGVNLTAVQKALEDGNVTREEQKEIWLSIKRMFAEEGMVPPSGKSNESDQINKWRIR